jgi:orotate phosphoribosyltransferase
MEKRGFAVSLENNPRIAMQVIPGHFTTSSVHLSHYLDMGGLKSDARLARDVARELAIPYQLSTPVDTIVCMERTEVIGAYLAEELMQSGVSTINDGNVIRIVTPTSNNLGHLSFPSSTVTEIMSKNVLLLTTSVSSGLSLDSALDCISYYHGKIAGISALFSVSSVEEELHIHAIFNSKDIPGYAIYSSRQCALCQAGIKLDALISSEGYTKI